MGKEKSEEFRKIVVAGSERLRHKRPMKAATPTMNATLPTPEINEADKVQVGVFRSRANLDSTTLRVGVKGYRTFREVYVLDSKGENRHLVCHIEVPANENWLTQNENRLLPVLRILDAGMKALTMGAA